MLILILLLILTTQKKINEPLCVEEGVADGKNEFIHDFLFPNVIHFSPQTPLYYLWLFDLFRAEEIGSSRRQL